MVRRQGCSGSVGIAGFCATYNAKWFGGYAGIVQTKTGTVRNYNPNDVYFAFGHSIMSNEQENAQIRLTDAQCKQIEINTLMSLRETLDDETLIKAICEALDIDYEEIKDKLPEDEERL